MNIVSYSLSASGQPEKKSDYHGQLSYSVRSLRAHNKDVAVHVFLYGEHPSTFIAELEDYAVSVHQMGAYADAIKRIRPLAFRTLTRYPVLHKWLNLSELEPLAPSQILRADCDTFFFDDVGRLFERYSERQFYAREEPLSRASHHGYDPSYLNEDALFTLARREGAAAVNPYNIGVCILNHGVWTEIASRSEQFLSYVFRFIASIARNPQTRETLYPFLTEFLAEDLAEEPEVADLPFPATNLWILDEVALWLTLGQIPGLTHGMLSREHVIQGEGESQNPHNAVVHHYFGMDKTTLMAEISRNFGDDRVIDER